MRYTRQIIEQQYISGKKMKYLFFWGHRKSNDGVVTSSCLSQWWQQSFVINGISYPTAEHYMMAEKARLFNDKNAEMKILASDSPGNAKQVGKEVIGFDQQIWEKNRMQIVIKGNFEKFNQNPELKAYLLNTKNRILVEASPVDTIWGIGLDRMSEFATIPVKWRGENLLGFALMEVRDHLNKN